jgi:hypothetical protein
MLSCGEGTESDRGTVGRGGQPARPQAQGYTREIRVFAEDVGDSARELRVRFMNATAAEVTCLSVGFRMTHMGPVEMWVAHTQERTARADAQSRGYAPSAAAAQGVSDQHRQVRRGGGVRGGASAVHSDAHPTGARQAWSPPPVRPRVPIAGLTCVAWLRSGYALRRGGGW